MKYLTVVIFFTCITISSFAQKPQAVPARLFSSRTDTYDGTSFRVHDSAHYTYSGDRGGGGTYRYGAANEAFIFFDLAHHLSASGIAWNDSAQTTKTYDAHDHLLTLLKQVSDGKNWINTTREVHSWVTNNKKEDTVASYYWNGSKWQPTSKYNYNYDSFGRTTDEFYEKGDTISGGWITDYWYPYHYNHNGDIDTIVSQALLWQSGAWQNNSLDVVIEDTVHPALTQLAYRWTAGAWAPYYLEIQVHSPGSTSDTTFNWSSNQSWIPSMLYLYTYDNNNRLINASTQAYNANGQTWIKKNMTNITYSPDNSAQQSIRYLGDAATNTWVPSANFATYFNQSGLIVSEMDSSWSQTTWAPTTNYYYWYTDNASSVGQASPERISSEAYPNPCAKTFTITFTAKKDGDATLKLYDMNGRMITRTVTNIFAGENKIIWDAGFALPKGCYAYQLIAGDAVSTGKIISE